jgi:hypothetical protein
MALKRAGIAILLLIALLIIAIAFFFLPHALETVAAVGLGSILVRLFALYGFLFVGIAALTTPFLAEITVAFGKPFIKVHHTFAAVGLVLITLHPVFYAVQRLSLGVFVPRFDSWGVFWALAGRPALYLLYVGVGAVLLRMKIPRYWRILHALVYVVLFFGIVHGNLLGEDFANLGITLTLDGLFAASMAGLLYKRYKIYRVKRKYGGLSKKKSPG